MSNDWFDPSIFKISKLHAMTTLSGPMRDFMHQLSTFATAVETDTQEIKTAMSLPVKTSSISTTNVLMLEDMKEESEHIRDQTTLLLHSLTSPTLEELCQLCAGLYEANVALADTLEDHLVDQTGGKYKRHQADIHNATMPDTSRLSGSGLQTADDSVMDSSALDTSKRASNLGAGIPAASQAYQSPVALPAHLQVEPKTPDLEDFEISSFSLGILQSAPPPPLHSAQQGSPPNPTPAAPLDLGPSPPPPTSTAALPPASSLAAPQTSLLPAEGATGSPCAPSVSRRGRGAGAAAPTEPMGETLFPLMPEVSPEELQGVPDYLQSQISCDELNGAIKKINEFVTDKRFDRDCEESADTLSMAEIQGRLKLGLKSKAFVLLLTTLRRLKTVKHKGVIVYSIVS